MAAAPYRVVEPYRVGVKNHIRRPRSPRSRNKQTRPKSLTPFAGGHIHIEIQFSAKVSKKILSSITPKKQENLTF